MCQQGRAGRERESDRYLDGVQLAVAAEPVGELGVNVVPDRDLAVRAGDEHEAAVLADGEGPRRDRDPARLPQLVQQPVQPPREVLPRGQSRRLEEEAAAGSEGDVRQLLRVGEPARQEEGEIRRQVPRGCSTASVEAGGGRQRADRGMHRPVCERPSSREM